MLVKFIVFPRDLVTRHFINLYLTIVFQYWESTLHTCIVAMSDKPWTSFQVVRNNLCSNMVCIKLVNRSIGEMWRTGTRAVVFRLFQETVILPPNPVGFRLTYTQLWDIFFIRYMYQFSWINDQSVFFFSCTRVL